MNRPDLIDDALLTRCAAIATPVAYPERDFSPPADGKYSEVKVFHNAPAWEAVGEGAQDQGLLQINVVWPKAQGIVKPMKAAADVMALFPKGAAYSSGGLTVRITAAPYATAPIVEPSRVIVPVTIPWSASR
jgi:hypothetical protein